MIEVLVFGLGLAALIMGWKYVTRSLDWLGNNISRTSNLLEDLTVSATLQTQRGVIISDDSLQDTVLESQEKSVKRAKKLEALTKGLGENEKTAVAERQKRIDALLQRKYE